MYLTRLYPSPNKYTENTGEAFTFGSECTIVLPDCLTDGEVKNIADLFSRFTFTASRANIVRGSGLTALVGGYPAAEAPDAGEYYTVHSDQRGAVVSAVSKKALIEGISMLMQLIIPRSLDIGSEEFAITLVDLADQPSIKVRMIHLCVFPESKMSTLNKAVAMAGFLGFTHVILEFWGMLRYDVSPSLSWDNAFTKTEMRSLVKLAQGWGMEVVPMINHLGHAAQSRVSMGRHTVLNQNPRMQLLFEPDGWTWCTTSSTARKLLSDVRSELMELCGDGEYFHLGFDEAYSFATCPNCRKHEPYKLLAEYINYLSDDLAKYGRRGIIWHDELISCNDFSPEERKNMVANGQSHNTHPALDLIDRRVVIADWQYNYGTDANPSTEYFIKKGFDVLCCPWDNPANVKALCNSTRNTGAFGIMMTTWDHLPAFISRMTRFGDYMHSDKPAPFLPISETAALLRKVYPEAIQTFEESGWRRCEVDD